MSSTNKTTNYNLSQFVGTDVPSYLGDYNSDISKIDKAIGDVANSQGSVEQSVVGLTAEVQGLSTQVSGVSTSVQQLQTSVAQIDSGYKQADTALSQRITTNANNIQTNTTAIEGINTTIGTEDISGIGDGTIKGAISDINSSLNNFFNPTQWDTNGLTYENASYSAGGYVRIGNLVIVNIRLTTSANDAKIHGLPVPMSDNITTLALTNTGVTGIIDGSGTLECKNTNNGTWVGNVIYFCK